MENLLKVIMDTYTKDILEIIHNEPNIKKTQVSIILAHSTKKIITKINEMTSLNLIEEKAGLNYNTKHLSLTDEGLRVLTLLRMIESGQTPDNPTNHGTSTEQGHTIKESE